MNYSAIALSAIALAAVSACSGGASGTTPTTPIPLPATPVTSTSNPPSSNPTVAATTSPVLLQAFFTTATRGAQSGFASSNAFAVYNFDLDLTTPGTSACLAPVPPATTGCTTFWPPIAPPAGVTLVDPFGTIVRPDGTLQLAYNNHPLYNYAEDTTAASAMGDGITASGGLWHLAQPQTADLGTPIVIPTPASTVLPYAATRK